MNSYSVLFFALLLCIVDVTVCETTRDIHDQRHPKSLVETFGNSDLEPVASERILDLGNLFNRYPNYQRPYYGGGGGGYNPYYPQMMGGYPQGSGGYYPGGTNMLGSGVLGGGGLGGFGGYGGWGGNGGLNSYYGYSNNNNYQGHRNLGYGYYRGTNAYGFIPSRESSFPTEGGYRGYN